MVPILLGAGIGVFFSGALDIKFLYTASFSAFLLLSALLLGHKYPFLKYTFLAAFFVVAGYSLASYRILSLATATLERELSPTNITGTVEKVHLYEDGKIRLTLRDTLYQGHGTA